MKCAQKKKKPVERNKKGLDRASVVRDGRFRRLPGILGGLGIILFIITNERYDAAQPMAAGASPVLLDYGRGPRHPEWLVGLLPSIRDLVQCDHCHHLGRLE